MELTLTCGVTSQGSGLGSGLTVGAAPRCCWDGTVSRFRSLVGYPPWGYPPRLLPPKYSNGYLVSPAPRTAASVCVELCGRISSRLPSALPSSQRRSSSRRCRLTLRPSGWRRLRGQTGKQNGTEYQLTLVIPALVAVLFFPAALDPEITRRERQNTVLGGKTNPVQRLF